MWKIFFEYSDKSKLTLTGKSKVISERLIEEYYKLYGRNAAKAIYQEYPKKINMPRDFMAMYKELSMERCPECGEKGFVVASIVWPGKFHVCCGNVPKEYDDCCPMICGFADLKGKPRWFDTEMEAIDYWNEQCRKVKRNGEHIQNDRLQAQKTEVG